LLGIVPSGKEHSRKESVTEHTSARILDAPTKSKVEACSLSSLASLNMLGEKEMPQEFVHGCWFSDLASCY
jgi:hypothetical protein